MTQQPVHALDGFATSPPPTAPAGFAIQPPTDYKSVGSLWNTWLLRVLCAAVMIWGFVGASNADAAQLATDLYADAGALAVFPTPPASGDLLSLRITARNGGPRPLNSIQAAVYHRSGGQDKRLHEVTIRTVPPRGAASDVVEWVWDTQGLIGPQTLVVHLDPNDLIQQGDENAANNVAQITIDLMPPPADEVGVQWAVVESRCCQFHYMTNTAVERDLDYILAESDAAFAFVEQALGIQGSKRMEVYLISRTIGHGGFASGYLVLSYHDRHYPNGRFREVMRHEITHGLQDTWANGDSITMMGEGLAVWVTGGHFKPEPVRERAASLLRINRYIPFSELIDDFYMKQHEISYIEAAGFVQYLVEVGGMDKLAETFRAMRRSRGDRDYAILDRALNRVYGKGVPGMEADYRAWLEATPRNAVQERDLANTVLFFDTVRRYQQALDPTAYFRTPWMPNIQTAQRRGLVADYIRHPETDINLAFETLLLAASEAQYRGEYDLMEQVLEVVNSILDAQQATPDVAWASLFTDPLAASTLDAVRSVQARGYEPQRIELAGDNASIWATRGPANPLYRLTARRLTDGWRLLEWVFRDWTVIA